jgi:formylmethanofuran dehydrogenase subunit B
VLTINEQSSYEAICVLRALIKRLPLDPKCVLEQTGLELEQWKGLAERLRCCRYGVIVWRAYDLHVERSLGRLIIELNDPGRFAGLSVNKSGMNSVGAEQVLAWRTGYPCAVNFTAGFPRYNPGESSASAVLERGEADAAVFFGFPNDVVLDDLETFASHHPTIEIAVEPEAVVSPAVFIRTAQPGLHSAGTIFRCDGVPLPLRSIVPTVLPAAELVLKQLLTALDRSQQITHAKAQRRKGER